MRVLRIKSNNMQNALAEARRQLGDGLTVLHTKQYDDSALFGLARKPVVEILAAVDSPAPSIRPAEGPTQNSELRTQNSDVVLLARQVADITQILERMDAGRDSTQPDRSPALERLLNNGVSTQMAEILTQEAGPEGAAEALSAIGRRIKCSGPISCDKGQARVALVGPTGAGKTTTAAKLASHYTLNEGKTVALLTLDTYRVGAIEQLATYARILNAPLEVGMCAEDVDAAVERHSDKDIIIIDTVGRSQRDQSNLDELARLLRQARPTEVHLTVSAQACPTAQKEAIDAFARLRVDRLLVTKLDEAPRLGILVDLAVAGLLPFSYVTFGQEVPDDLAVADKDSLSRLVWEGSL
ncbi:MAG: flagellar biosynthesis protein FlhF [Armatimonadota bacterium]|nr:flagellar biosynthesis protein FlhF [Armatimonadota bacterium]